MLEDRPSLGERYEDATSTSDLTVCAERRTDADMLLAAGFVAAGNARGSAALTLYRMHAIRCRHGSTELQKTAAGWLMNRYRRAEDMRSGRAMKIAETVIDWWLDGVCKHCQGRRYELVPGTQVVSDNLCRVCDGRGKEPVEHRLPKLQQHAGRWLACEFESLMSYVLAEMARKLRPNLDI